MFSEETIRSLVEQNKVSKELIEQLLTLYVAPLDNWWDHALTLRSRLIQNFGEDRGNEVARQCLAFTILIPAFDRHLKIDFDSPQRLLFGSGKFEQFKERDWFGELKKVVLRDQQISVWRQEVLSLGFIDPIDYQAFSRQAYKWLCERAEDEGALTPEVKDKFRKLVMAYGGAVISNIFSNHSSSLKKVVNWRTGYFVERIMYDIYSVDQIVKIKRAELEKTNVKWVKQFKQESSQTP